MVEPDCVDDVRRFVVAGTEISADLDVVSFDLLANRFTDIVQQACTFCFLDVQSHLASQDSA